MNGLCVVAVKEKKRAEVGGLLPPTHSNFNKNEPQNGILLRGAE